MLHYVYKLQIATVYRHHTDQTVCQHSLSRGNAVFSLSHNLSLNMSCNMAQVVRYVLALYSPLLW
jgi:hypothetical protein